MSRDDLSLIADQIIATHRAGREALRRLPYARPGYWVALGMALAVALAALVERGAA